MGKYIKHWTSKLGDTYTKKLVLKEGDRIYFMGKPKLNRLDFKKYIKNKYSDVKVVSDISLANIYVLPAYARDTKLEYASYSGHYTVPEINGIVHCNNIPESVLETLKMSLLEFYQKYEKLENITSYYVSIKPDELIKCQDLDKVYHEVAISDLMNQEKALGKELLDESGKSAMCEMIDTYNYSVVKALLESYNEYSIIKEVAIQALALYLRDDYKENTHTKYNTFKTQVVDSYPLLKRLFDHKNMIKFFNYGKLNQNLTGGIRYYATFLYNISNFIKTINTTISSDIVLEDVFRYIYPYNPDNIGSHHHYVEQVFNSSVNIARMFNCDFKEVYKVISGRDIIFHNDIYEMLINHREMINDIASNHSSSKYRYDDVTQMNKETIAIRVFKSLIQSIRRSQSDIIGSISKSIVMQYDSANAHIDNVLYIASLLDFHNVVTNSGYRDSEHITKDIKQSDMLVWLLSKTCDLNEYFNDNIFKDYSFSCYQFVKFMRSELFNSKTLEDVITTFANV